MFQARIAELRMRVPDLEGAIATVKAHRETFGLGKIEGNPRSAKAWDDCTAKMRDLESDLDATQAAIATLEENQRQHDAEVAAEDLRRRWTETDQLSRELVATSQKIDETLSALRELFSSRNSLLRSIASLDTVQHSLISSGQRVWKGAAACRAAGLHDFISMEHIDPPHIRSLAELDASLVSHFVPQTPEEEAA